MKYDFAIAILQDCVELKRKNRLEFERTNEPDRAQTVHEQALDLLDAINELRTSKARVE